MIYLALGRKYEGNVYSGPWKAYSFVPVERSGAVVAGKPPFHRIHVEQRGESFEVVEYDLQKGTMEYGKVLKRVSQKRNNGSIQKSHRNVLPNVRGGSPPRCVVKDMKTLLERLKENYK